MENQIVGIFYTEEDAIQKVEELELQGYDANDIYAVAKNEGDISLVRGKTNIDVQAGNQGWFDRFVGFLIGDEPVREALYNAGLVGDEMDTYYQEIDNGGIFIYIDKTYGYDEPYQQNSGANYVNYEEETSQNIMNTNENDLDDTTRVRLHEERLNVDKQNVESGEITINKYIVEDEQTVQVPVSREEVSIERRQVDQDATTGENAALFDENGESITIPIKEERIKVTKEPVVNEEIVVKKQNVEGTETVSDTVRREEVDIDGDSDQLQSNGENLFTQRLNQQDQDSDSIYTEEEKKEKRNEGLETMADNPYTDEDRANPF